MKNIRNIYEKLREVKYLHLVKLYKKHLKKIPDNCLYNCLYKVSEDTIIRLCLLHQPELDLNSEIMPHLIEVCQEPKHCSNCNAFVLKYSKEDVKNIFSSELENKKIKAEKYPDVCALEWVLNQPYENINNIKWYNKIIYFIKRKIFIL